MPLNKFIASFTSPFEKTAGYKNKEPCFQRASKTIETICASAGSDSDAINYIGIFIFSAAADLAPFSEAVEICNKNYRNFFSLVPALQSAPEMVSVLGEPVRKYINTSEGYTVTASKNVNDDKGIGCNAHLFIKRE